MFSAYTSEVTCVAPSLVKFIDPAESCIPVVKLSNFHQVARVVNEDKSLRGCPLLYKVFISLSSSLELNIVKLLILPSKKRAAFVAPGPLPPTQTSVLATRVADGAENSCLN